MTVSTICFSALFKVVDVSLNATVVYGSNEQILDKTEAVLTNYNGKNLVFINEDTLKSEIESTSPYVKVDKIEKIFPNKIKVSVVERKEFYSVAVDGYYYILDDEFYCVSKKQEDVSNVPNARNVTLNVNVADYSVSALQVGKKFELNDATTQSLLSTLTTKLVGKSNEISFVTVKVKENAYYNRQITLGMLEGVNFVLDKADVNLAEKFDFAYNYYLLMPNKTYDVLTISVSAETGEYIVS